MPVEIVTARGLYRLSAAGSPEREGDAIVLALAMERADGIERIVTRCRVLGMPANEPVKADEILEQLKDWIAANFEQTREAALRTIRSEQRLHEITFELTKSRPAD